MILSKSFIVSLGFAFASFFITPVPAFAKQKLDQPPILTAQSMTQVAKIQNYTATYIAVDKTGRIFAAFKNHNRDAGPALALIDKNGSVTPYPGGSWNEWNKGSSSVQPNPATAFIGLSGMTLTPDGNLWILDSGIEKTGSPAIINGVKIIQINTGTNQIVKTYPIPASAMHAKSILNAIAIYGNHAYLADSGQPALIVLDLKTGEARRILENSFTLYSRKAIIINHQLIRPDSDMNSQFSVNQLAISPDGKSLYYQAVSGPLFRLDTMFLNDPTYTLAELNEAMIQWIDTPPSGGIACDQQGNLYFTDIATGSIYRFTTGRILTKLITDPRLQEPGHPFALNQNHLYIPVIHFLKDKKANTPQQSTLYQLSIPSPN